jgi:hypothetical protein
MEHGGKAQGPRHRKGIREVVSQGTRFVASLQGLVRIPQPPQSPGCPEETRRPQVLRIQGNERTVLRLIVECHALLEMEAGWFQLPKVE